MTNTRMRASSPNARASARKSWVWRRIMSKSRLRNLCAASGPVWSSYHWWRNRSPRSVRISRSFRPNRARSEAAPGRIVRVTLRRPRHHSGAGKEKPMIERAPIRNLDREWTTSPRWKGIRRPYSAKHVERLRGTIGIEHTLARRGAENLWDLLHREECVAALSALSGGQAVQEVRAGLKAIYVSGWQVAAEANGAAEVYPDLSLYPCTSAPELVRRINNALLRADQIHHLRGDDEVDWLVPVVADAEAGFGGALNSFEIMKAMIAAGAAAVHFEDQLSAVKKCGHMGGKVLVPTREFIGKLVAARLSADVCGVDTI